MDCANYSACLDHALERRWRGFTCARGCTGYTPIANEEQLVEAPKLTRLVARIFEQRRRAIGRLVRLAVVAVVQARRGSA